MQRYKDWERYNEAEDTGHGEPIDPDADAERYREEIDQALKAEDQGFDSLWMVEHHVSPYAMILNMFCAETHEKAEEGAQKYIRQYADSARRNYELDSDHFKQAITSSCSAGSAPLKSSKPRHPRR
jgi:alkanesulfonate monooxygenase SsuD/methylene tetrahydromethanopterin reductase-like flavin-dependent oxidoreductase (luciferase family)